MWRPCSHTQLCSSHIKAASYEYEEYINLPSHFPPSSMMIRHSRNYDGELQLIRSYVLVSIEIAFLNLHRYVSEISPISVISKNLFISSKHLHRFVQNHWIETYSGWFRKIWTVIAFLAYKLSLLLTSTYMVKLCSGAINHVNICASSST